MYMYTPLYCVRYLYHFKHKTQQKERDKNQSNWMER